MAYYPVKLQKLNETTEVWTDINTLHAIQVNKTGGGETFSSGADQYHPWLTFTFRWTPQVEAIAYAPQKYRFVYRGHTFDLRDYDDYQERHQTVRISGVCYG